MNKQKNTMNQQEMNKSQNSATSSVNNSSVTSSAGSEQSLNAKQKASKSQYGTLTAKDDANQDYE